MTREEINKRIMQACKNTWNENVCKEIEESLEQEQKAKKVIKMRDATPEERESIDKYIKSISTTTGVDFWDLEPCEDCVSRQAVDHLCFRFLRANSDDNIAFYEHFRDLPSVTPTRKKGKWVVEDSGNYNGKYSTCYCSNCKDYYTRVWREMKYCPNCGVEMESEE